MQQPSIFHPNLSTTDVMNLLFGGLSSRVKQVVTPRLAKVRICESQPELPWEN